MKSIYVCQQCGFESAKWLGKCPSCDSWNSFVESVVQTKKGSSATKNTSPKNFLNLSQIKVKKSDRFSTQISEFDRCLGGGIVPGQVILLAGEPGIGKSTILLQLAQNLTKVVYISGEESAHQLKLRADRLSVNNKNIEILEETNIDTIISSLDTHDTFDARDTLVIVDSIQTMHTDDLSGMAGSVGQVRECAYRLTRFAKTNNVPMILVGQVTKDGTVAGPATLMHLVDTVCWFEGDKTYSLRMLRAIKNRFGPTDEVGLFSMEEKGLVPIADASKLFLDANNVSRATGSCTAVILEGTRPILVEVQSLCIKSKLINPRIVSQGIDVKRLQMIIAILTKRGKLALSDQDVYVNVVGGIKIKEPAADLAIALSIASSFKDKPLVKNLIAISELGLLGEVRPVLKEESRLKEAKRLGYKNIITSQKNSSIDTIIRNCF